MPGGWDASARALGIRWGSVRLMSFLSSYSQHMADKSDLVKSVYRASHVHLGFASCYDRLAALLGPSEQPVCALNVRSLWIGGEMVKGRPPILLLTSDNMIVQKIDPSAGTLLLSKIDFETFPLTSITHLSTYEKGFFEVSLTDGRTVRARRIGSWTGFKYAQKFYDTLTSALAHV